MASKHILDFDDTKKFIKALGGSIRIVAESESEFGSMDYSRFEITISGIGRKAFNQITTRLRKEPVMATKKVAKTKKTKTTKRK